MRTFRVSPMHRSDGINVAVGGLLVGISAVILGLLSPTAAAIVAIACAATGIYMIVGGVYLGLPTPTTAVERALAPRLRSIGARVTRIVAGDPVFSIRIQNTGRDDLNDALINLTVPDDFHSLKRCTASGEVNRPEHRGSFWDEDGQKFWNGTVAFPGRSLSVFYFRATLPTVHDFSVTFKVHSPALDEPPEFPFHLSVAEGEP
jgi:hypothetical protein